jgi:hypothetical protein
MDTTRKPLTTAVRENITYLMVSLDISQMALQKYLPLAQSSVSRRVMGATPWGLREIDRISQLIGVTPCRITGLSPDALRAELADKRAMYRENMNDLRLPVSRATQHALLSEIYSPDFADMQLGKDAAAAA